MVTDARQGAQRRRDNFFRGTMRDHDSSYQHLRAELGEENTNRLITNIGTLAMSSGIEASGVSLSDAVKRIIGSLTPAERSAIASGGVAPPRVQALIDSELKAAQQQRQAQLTAAATTAGDTLPGNRSGLIPAAFAAMDRELRGRTARSSEYSDLRSDSISSANYSSSEFARTGLNYTAFSDLRRQGFNAPQIMAAAKETKSLGIDTNRNAAPMARVQRDIPSAVAGLHTTRDNWTAVRDLEAEKKKALEAGNSAAVQALTRQIEARRKSAEEHDASERARVQQERPDRAGDHRQLQDETRKAALRHEASLGVRNDATIRDQAASQPRPEDRARTDRHLAAAAVVSTQADQTQVEHTRTRNAALLEDTPPQPTRHAAAEPTATTPIANQPAAAPIKIADATTPARPQTSPPRMASPTARA